MEIFSLFLSLLWLENVECFCTLSSFSYVKVHNKHHLSLVITLPCLREIQTSFKEDHQDSTGEILQMREKNSRSRCTGMLLSLDDFSYRTWYNDSINYLMKMFSFLIGTLCLADLIYIAWELYLQNRRNTKGFVGTHTLPVLMW